MIRILLILAIIFPTVHLSGDLNRKLNDFYNSFGSSVNVSSADVYNGQKAGYATGGGVTIKNRVINSKLAHIDLPKIDAGCGGIDIYAGGLSFINSDELINTLKLIGSNAKGYAFLLGMETVSPQITNTIKQLQSWANTINGIGINSCETAAQLVGSVWPRDTMASQHICRTVGGQNNMFSDYISGRHQCGIPQNAEHANYAAREKYPEMLIQEYNLAWNAIQKQSSFKSDQEFAELLMTLLGTVIVRKNGDKSETLFYPSRIKDESFLRTIIEGGNASIYKCKDTKQCLIIAESPITLDSSLSWLGKVRSKLIEIQSKIINDTELCKEEMDFLAKSRLPLYKIVNVLTAYKKGICPIDLYQVADIVAMDILAQCLREGIESVRDGCFHLRRQQMYGDEIDQYVASLDRISEEVRRYETQSMHMVTRELQIMQKMQILEEQIASEINLY